MSIQWRAFRGTKVRLRRFGGDPRGATAVEFGIIVMPFLAILFAVFEIGFVNLQSELLTNAVTDAARAMLTGNLQTTGITTSQQFVSNYLCQKTGRTLPSSFNCSNLIVDVRSVATFVAGDTTNDFYKSASNKFCPGQPGQIIVMRVAYPLPAIFPSNLFSSSMGVVTDVPNLAGRYHMIMGEALFQEENYSGTYASASGC